MSRFLLGVATGAMLLYGAMTFHLVRASDGVHFVAKVPAHLSEVYVDIRQFGVADWADHPQLAAALVHANRQDLLGQSAVGAIQDGVHQLVPSWPSE